jgi:hypothetical protein
LNQYEASGNIPDTFGKVPLQYAIDKDDVSSLASLLRHGATVDGKSKVLNDFFYGFSFERMEFRTSSKPFWVAMNSHSPN